MSRGGLPWPKTIETVRARAAEDEVSGIAYTPLTKRQTIFLENFAKILTIRGAAKATAIRSDTHNAWLKKSPTYRRAFLSVWDNLAEKAFAIGFKDAFDEGDTKAKELYLKAFYPELFNTKRKHEISGPDGGSIEVNHASPPLAHIIQRLNALTEGNNQELPEGVSATPQGIEHHDSRLLEGS